MKPDLGVMTSSISQDSTSTLDQSNLTTGAMQVTVKQVTHRADTFTIINFILYNCEELTDTDIIQYLDEQENKETNKYLSA